MIDYVNYRIMKKNIFRNVFNIKKKFNNKDTFNLFDLYFLDFY